MPRRAQAAASPPRHRSRELLPKAGTRHSERAAWLDRWSSPGFWGLLALVVIALILRVRHLSHGLPEFTEEAIPFRKALEMWRPDGSVDWNPHLFHYPSLTIYLQLAIQKLTYIVGHGFGHYERPADFLLSFQIDPTPMVLAGRAVGVLSALVTLVCVVRIGERLRPGAGMIAGALVAVAPTLILASRSIFTDTVMTALALTAIERMLAWRDEGGRGKLVAIAVLIGLAAGAKYPAIILLFPLGWVMYLRLGGTRSAGPWIACTAGALAVFVLTTPYMILDARTFTRDFLFVSRLGSAGHFGNIDRPGFGFHLTHLREDIGLLGVILLPVSLVWTLVRPARRAEGVALWIAGLGFGVPIAVAHVLAERYLVPVIPIAAILVSLITLDVLALVPARARRFALPVGLLLLVAPPLIAGLRAAELGARSTQTLARQWCEQRLGHDVLIVQELYSASLLSRLETFAVQSRPIFPMASAPMQQRFRARRWFSCVPLPLVVVGSPVVTLNPPSGRPVEVQVFPHVADFNQACYDPRLFAGVDYLVTSSQVRGRFEADTARYGVPMRFYALLDSTAEIAARFVPNAGDLGPTITIYRLGPTAHAAIARRGRIDPSWWAEPVPDSYRLRADSLLSPPGRRTGVALRDSSGNPAAWVWSLGGVFQTRYASFTRAMALELMEHRRFDHAAAFARSLLEADPGDVQACLMFVNCARELNGWRDARVVLERAIAIGAGGGASSPYLRLEYADVLTHEGEFESAYGELQQVLASGDSYLIAEAQRRFANRLPGAPQRPGP